MKGLYLKLDNKLTLSLDTLKIKKSKQSSIDVQTAIKWFQESLIVISYFEKIDIKKIILPNQQKASIFYDGKSYKLDFPDIQGMFEIHQDSQTINLEVQKLIFYDAKAQLNGQMIYDIAQGKVSFSLVAQAYGHLAKQQEKLILKGTSNLRTINIQAFSTPIESLHSYAKELQKFPTLYHWLLQKTSFKTIRIKNLFFSAPLNEHFVPKMLKSLYAEIDLEEVALKFEPELEPIITPNLKIKFQNRILKFDLSNPSYQDLNLQGSFVEIYNLTQEDKGVETLVSLRSKDAILDQRIHQILQAYEIDFDIQQLDSTLDLSLQLLFHQISDEDFEVQAKGIFKAQDAHFDLFGSPIFAKQLEIALNIDENGKHLFINKSKLAMQDPHIEGTLNLDINLLDQSIQGKLFPSLIQVTTAEADSPLQQFFILNANDIPHLQISATYADTPTIDIPDLGIKLSLGDQKTITLDNFAKLKPFSPFLQYLSIHEGQARIETSDFQNFQIQTEISQLNYPIFDEQWNPIQELKAQIRVTPNRISFASADESIKLNYNNAFLKIQLKNKNFDFHALESTQIPALSLKLSSTPSPNHLNPTSDSKTSKQALNLYLEATHSLIKYKDFIIPTDEIIVNIKDNKTKLDATYKNGVVNLDFVDGIIKFKANNFSGNFINLIAKKELVQGGLFSAKGLYKKKILKAEIEAQNTTFKYLATLQNIVALIDTVPSLIVFKKPGFSSEGYQVTRGRVVLELNQDYLGLKKIDLVGETIDISGGGIVALDTEELNVSLTISTIKGLSEALSKIPIVGYLLLGKEGKISTNLILKGTLQNPKSEVTLAEDILSAPFKIIQRIFVPE